MEEEVCRFQGDNKIMSWAGIVDGKTLEICWMVDDEGCPETVTSACNLDMLKTQVWPEIRAYVTRQQWWWQQDSARPYTTNEVLDFVGRKFGGWVISRRSDIDWPVYSPDLNPLDFFLWGYVQSLVRRRKPKTIDELKEAVEDVAASIPEDMIRASAGNLRRHCEACLMVDGGHFEHFLKSF